jgi:hypothetical protein
MYLVVSVNGYKMSVFIYMMKISGEKPHPCPMAPVCLYSLFTEIRFLLHIIMYTFYICWGTSSLAKICNSFFLLILSKVFF